MATIHISEGCAKIQTQIYTHSYFGGFVSIRTLVNN